MDDHERELRRLRLEARELRRDVEGAEAELEASTTSLVDVLRDWAAQGRVVQLDAADRQRRGRVVHVGVSVLTLEQIGGICEVVVLRHVEGIITLGVSGAPRVDGSARHPPTLIAHLRALVGREDLVTLDRRSTEPARGHVLGVGEGHVTIRAASGDTMMVPLDAVVAVTTA